MHHLPSWVNFCCLNNLESPFARVFHPPKWGCRPERPRRRRSQPRQSSSCGCRRRDRRKKWRPGLSRTWENISLYWSICTCIFLLWFWVGSDMSLDLNNITITWLKARSDLRNSHAFTQWDRQFSNSLLFCTPKKSDYHTAFYAARLKLLLSWIQTRIIRDQVWPIS